MKFLSTDPPDRKTNVVLWILQSLLALLFMFAGVMKFVMSIEEMTKQIALPGSFLHFIGVAEILGAIGLILPGVLRIRVGLAPLAAAGLAIITVGATVITVKGGQVGVAMIPLVVAVLSALVAYSRWRMMPGRDSSRAPVTPRADGSLRS
jgi:uncharacterized membrane protein YphA (DoxX/SURF4 family)